MLVFNLVLASDPAKLNMNAVTSTPDAFSRSLLLLSFTDLVAEGFPVPIHVAGGKWLCLVVLE